MPKSKKLMLKESIGTIILYVSRFKLHLAKHESS